MYCASQGKYDKNEVGNIRTTGTSKKCCVHRFGMRCLANALDTVRLCTHARPSASDVLDTDLRELWRKLALPKPEPELVFGK
jgi:hypothetical protein